MYSSTGASVPNPGIYKQIPWNSDNKGKRYCKLSLEKRLTEPVFTRRMVDWMFAHNTFPNVHGECPEPGSFVITPEDIKKYNPAELRLLAHAQTDGFLPEGDYFPIPPGAQWGFSKQRADRLERAFRGDPADASTIKRYKGLRGWGIGAEDEAAPTDTPKDEEKKLKPVHMALIGAGVLGVGFLLLRKK